MRHSKTGRKFSRKPSHRKAMFRNMLTDLFRHERLETTIFKAKDLRGIADKYITIAGDDTLHARRKAYNYLQDKAVVHKLFTDLGPRFKTRPGGYTRVVRTKTRSGDAAELAVIELLQDTSGSSKKAAKSSSKKPTAKAAKTNSETVAAETESETAKAPEKKASSKKAATSKSSAKTETKTKKAKKTKKSE
ncbi:MAG: 50S ribosomal protein L17 [Bdellovibrionales bacterium]|nr:50S ribosomal protein L17 [Bdellovibrionales bacterium]